MRVEDEHLIEVGFVAISPASAMPAVSITLPRRGVLQVVDSSACRVIAQTGFDGDASFVIDSNGQIGVVGSGAAPSPATRPLAPVGQSGDCGSYATSANP